MRASGAMPFSYPPRTSPLPAALSGLSPDLAVSDCQISRSLRVHRHAPTGSSPAILNSGVTDCRISKWGDSVSRIDPPPLFHAPVRADPTPRRHPAPLLRARVHSRQLVGARAAPPDRQPLLPAQRPLENTFCANYGLLSIAYHLFIEGKQLPDALARHWCGVFEHVNRFDNESMRRKALAGAFVDQNSLPSISPDPAQIKCCGDCCDRIHSPRSLCLIRRTIEGVQAYALLAKSGA